MTLKDKVRGGRRPGAGRKPTFSDDEADAALNYYHHLRNVLDAALIDRAIKETISQDKDFEDILEARSELAKLLTGADGEPLRDLRQATLDAASKLAEDDGDDLEAAEELIRAQLHHSDNQPPARTTELLTDIAAAREKINERQDGPMEGARVRRINGQRQHLFEQVARTMSQRLNRRITKSAVRKIVEANESLMRCPPQEDDVPPANPGKS